MKVTEYITVPAGQVNLMLEKGYQPYGSPVVVKTGDSYSGFLMTITQAMVKYETPINTN